MEHRLEELIAVQQVSNGIERIEYACGGKGLGAFVVIFISTKGSRALASESDQMEHRLEELIEVQPFPREENVS